MKKPPAKNRLAGEEPTHQIAEIINSVAVDTYGGRVTIEAIRSGYMKFLNETDFLAIKKRACMMKQLTVQVL